MNTLKRPGNLYYTCVQIYLHNSGTVLVVCTLRADLAASAAATPHLNSVSVKRAVGFFTSNGSNKFDISASPSARIPLSRVKVAYCPKLNNSESLLILSIPPALWGTEWFQGIMSVKTIKLPIPLPLSPGLRCCLFGSATGEHIFHYTF